MSHYRSRRSLWRRSPHFRRLVWTSVCVFALFAIGHFAQQAKTATSAATQSNAQYQPPAHVVQPPRASAAVPAANIPSTAPSLRDIQTAGDTSMVLQNTAAPQNVLDNFPLAEGRWADALPGTDNIPASGFAAYYLTTGDPKALKQRDPFMRGAGDSYLPPALDSSLASYTPLWRENRTRLAHRENVSSIAIQYSYNELKNIPSQQFAAYWAGYLHVPESAVYQFHIHQGHSVTRVMLDKRRIHEGHGNKADDIRLPPGKYLLEVEYVNGWHTTDFRLDVSPVPNIMQTHELHTPLARLDLPGNTVVYAASVGRSNGRSGRISFRYPTETRPYLLMLSSEDQVHWDIYGNNPPRAIIYNNAQQGSTVGAEGQPPGIAWNGSFRYRGEKLATQCECQNGNFLCREHVDSLASIATNIKNWSGYPLAGISGANHADSLPMPQTIVTHDALLANNALMEPIEQKRQLCLRLSGKQP